MIEYVCDYCARVKRSRDEWILGFAAESVGVTAARREVAIASSWDESRAREWLAVHFCSESCRDGYMARLFGRDEVDSEVMDEVVVTPGKSRKKVVAIARRQRTPSKPVRRRSS